MKDIVTLYGKIYLNRHLGGALKHISTAYDDAGFLGCVGCLDCIKLVWTNFPLAEKEQCHNPYEGKIATIVGEGWCDRHLHIWSSFAGRTGTNNNITVLSILLLIQDILNGTFSFSSTSPYKIHRNGIERYLYYFLWNVISPDWTIFANPLHQAQGDDEHKYTSRQEAIRKDIER